MDIGLWGVVTTLAVAIGSGLAFIAYRHPSEFQPFGLILVGLLICVETGIFVWNVAVSRTWWSITEAKVIESGKFDQLKAAIELNYVSSWWDVVIIGIVVYLAFLGTLRLWLLKPNSDEQSD